jgi:ferredoxin-NADP reductase
MITAMVSMRRTTRPQSTQASSALIHCDRKPRTVQERAKVTAVLAIVTIKHELLKFPENLLGLAISRSVIPAE